MTEEPTTPDLVELTRRAVECASRGDLDAVLGFFAPDAEWDSWRVGETFEGRAAIRQRFEDWHGVFEDLNFEIREILDLGNGVVFAAVHQDARPTGSSAHVEAQEGWVVVWEEGLIVRRAAFADIDEARAAAERLAKERADG
jgi:ketosteroid isomerase-like protein